MFSDDFAIQIHGISKRFEIFRHPKDQLKQLIFNKLRALYGLPSINYYKEFWALRNITLHMLRGCSYGIIGMNGCGKSTLLQIIAGTLYPTLGQVDVHGKIAALLELGSGFNPEFTGRENAYFNGILWGMSPNQISERIDEIAAFADIGAHFDQPIHTYSSGMHMRVAFSVATSFQPDILIVDEALAVGDAYFQQKCFHRMQEFKEKGGTLLFVSHDTNAVKSLCDYAVLLDKGELISIGKPKDIIDQYHGLIAKHSDKSENPVSFSSEAERPNWIKATSITSNDTAILKKVRLLNNLGQQITHIESDQLLTVEYHIKLLKTFERPAFGLIIRDKLGRSIFETSTYAMGIADTPINTGANVCVQFNMQFNLKSGQYSFSIGVANKGFSRSEFEEYSLLVHDAEQIEVFDQADSIFYGGIFNIKPSVDIKVSYQ